MFHRINVFFYVKTKASGYIFYVAINYVLQMAAVKVYKVSISILE